MPTVSRIRHAGLRISSIVLVLYRLPSLLPVRVSTAPAASAGTRGLGPCAFDPAQVTIVDAGVCGGRGTSSSYLANCALSRQAE